jgi:Abhydrolase family
MARMKNRSTVRCAQFLLVGLLSATSFTLLAQTGSQSAPADGPDPHEIPQPAIKTIAKPLPGVDKLAAHPDMPDILTMNDGTKVTTLAQWKKRREEIKRILEYYAVGTMPPPPGNVRGEEIKSEMVLDGKVKYRLVKLTFGPERKLELYIGVFTPTDAKGPVPAIISQASEPPGGPELPRSAQGPNQGKGQDVLMMVGPSTAPAAAPRIGGGRPPLTAEAIAKTRTDVFQRGYALVIYNDNDCAEDTTLREADGSFTFRHTRFYPAYPGYDWGILGGWAWGASRVADYLVTDPAIDKTKLIITGASRAGKSSMVAAAFDDRLMGAPVVTGGGGIGAYRFAGPDNSETLDIMQKKYPNWFSPHLHEFWGQREKLPFDEHWFLALCAPRPFIALEGDADTISYPVAVEHSIEAAWKAYDLYGKGDDTKLGIHYSHHPHAFTTEDWTAMMDFADANLRGMTPTKTFDHFLTLDQRKAAVADLASRAPGRGGAGGGAPTGMDPGPPQ